tara:strand:- start:570 stop:887 length:318 start_codon:yes stop_codon:yes gene_type:complete
MSYRWPDKDKDEIVDYSVDWSRFLGNDTVAATAWYIKDSSGVKTLVEDVGMVNGLQFVTGTLSGRVTTARFSLGTNNTRYTVICGITTGSGLQYERSIFLRVREK